MKTGRLEAFSDGVIAIIITIMVLEMKVPLHAARFADLWPVLPVFLGYLLSYIYVGIYWNNHHHLYHVTERVTGGILWANLHLLFWLSLIPFATEWLGENHAASQPTALYGFILLMAGFAYWIMEKVIVANSTNSLVAKALGKEIKGRLALLSYAIAIPLAFVHPWLANALYILVAMMWIIPDRRLEQAMATSDEKEPVVDPRI